MICVKVPATSANCCVGFDTLGMALDWFATFYFEPNPEFVIEGCSDEFKNEDNLVIVGFKKTCDYMKVDMPTLKLKIDTDIPSSRGLGSSSTCIVAGIMAADAWFHGQLNKMEMLKIATEIEGHPDNVAPAIFGQACTSFMDDGDVRMMMIPCQNFKGLAMIPDYPIQTSEARKVLPQTIDYKDAVKQIGYALSFVQCLSSGNELIFPKTCHDFLHEPYRGKLIKEYAEIHDYCKSIDLAMWISGSGSTMLAMSLDEKKLDMLQEWIVKYSGMSYKKVSISTKGAYIEYE